jgi:hypothetical protein
MAKIARVMEKKIFLSMIEIDKFLKKSRRVLQMKSQSVADCYLVPRTISVTVW